MSENPTATTNTLDLWKVIHMKSFFCLFYLFFIFFKIKLWNIRGEKRWQYYLASQTLSEEDDPIQKWGGNQSEGKAYSIDVAIWAMVFHKLFLW